MIKRYTAKWASDGDFVIEIDVAPENKYRDYKYNEIIFISGSDIWKEFIGNNKCQVIKTKHHGVWLSKNEDLNIDSIWLKEIEKIETKTVRSKDNRISFLEF